MTSLFMCDPGLTVEQLVEAESDERIKIWLLIRLGREKISLSRRVKDSVKSALKFINDFEKTAAEIAIGNGYDFVVCGHIHHPEMNKIKTHKAAVIYLN